MYTTLACRPKASLAARFRDLPGAHPADALQLQVGCVADYKALAEHHYRADRPATMTRILALRPRGGRGDRTLADRFLNRTATTGSSEAPGAGVVAVLVESMPTLNCRLRDYALHDRYGGWLAPRQRAALIRDELRCISRVIVHPQWRGLGLAVRLVRAALADAQTRYTEAFAAMGRVNPFFEHAGMIAYRRPEHECDARLVAALRRLGLDATALATLDRTWAHIARQSEADRRWFIGELRRWHRRNGGRAASSGAGRDTDPREHLRVARQRLLLRPVYYLHDNVR